MKPGTLRAASLGVMAGAVAVRLAAWISIGQTGFSRHPLVDAYTYWDQATKMLAGEDPFAEGFYQPPGYPAVLWVLGKLQGGELTLGAARLLNLGLGVLTTGGLLWLGGRLGRRWEAPWLGLAAAAVYTLYPTTILFELDLLTPAVTSALLVGSLCLLEAEDTPGPGRSVASGLLLGLASVVHATYLLAAAIIGGLLFRVQGGRRTALGLLAGVAIALTPTTYTNLTRFHEPALVSYNAGMNFYLGNSAEWKRNMFLRPGLEFRQLVLQAEPDKLDGYQRDRYWRERTWSEIGADPLHWAGTLATKALWSVNRTEIPRNEDYRCRTRGGPLAWVGWLPARYGWLFPLAVVGAVGVWRRGGRDRVLVGAWLALHATLVLFMVADRYRLATWPLVSLLAPLGVLGLGRLFRKPGPEPTPAPEPDPAPPRESGRKRGSRRKRQRYQDRRQDLAQVRVAGTAPAPEPWVRHPVWFFVAGAVVLPWVPIDPITSMNPGWCAHVEGNLVFMDEDFDAARKAYGECAELDPDDIGCRYWLARVLDRQRDTDAAIMALLPVVETFPDYYPALYFMSQLMSKAGNASGAADYAGRAYRVPGERTNTGIRYVKLLVEAGRSDEARQVVKRDKKLQGHPKLRGVLD